MKRGILVTGALLVGFLLSTLSIRAADNNLIANPSVESINSNGLPHGWQSGSWGENQSTLSIKSPGRTGSKSLRVDIKSYSNGDAKWMHEPAEVVGGKKYVYTSWYKSNISSEVDFQYYDVYGNVSYTYAATISPSETWGELSIEFETPADAARVSVMHMIFEPGYLETDDVSLALAADAPTPPVSGNLIANESLESASGLNPAGWNKNTWGENSATFSYLNSGRSGSRSVRVDMLSIVSGDAKWYADPVSVVGGKAYHYSDFYKSNTPTRVVAAYIDASGGYSYVELKSAPASSTWSEYQTEFTTPQSAVRVSIYHIIDRPGWLILDDVSLKAKNDNPLPEVTLFANPSAEQLDGGSPLAWNSNNWGENTAKFEHLNQGRTGSRSLKVTVSNYRSGDAKWYPQPVKGLEAGKSYKFSVWYKTNAVPQAVAMFNMNDGTTRYAGLPVPRPAADAATKWQSYSGAFSVPEGAVSVSAFMLIGQNGWLQTDDYGLEAYQPEGFARPLLTLTFDDGHEDNKTTALPLLNKYGIKTTQCYATEFIEGHSQEVIDGVLAFSKSGHEICSHTVTHPFLTSLTASQLDYELKHSGEYLRRLTGQPVLNFASPYGNYNAKVIDGIDNYYASHRSVDEGYNSKDNFDIYNIRVQNILSTTTASEVAGWVARAQAENTWLVLVYHRVANDAGTYDTTPKLFAEHIDTVRASGITVKTYQDALNEIKPQL